MAQNKSWKELMELQGAAGGTNQQKANAMLELIEGRQPFAYDPNTDPTARAVRQETARNIQRSTQDTLGAHAGMTGGVPSSAAVSAAAQAGNQAAVTGADRIAELEQLARQNYMNEGTQMKNYWGMLQGLADSEYNRQMQEQQIAYQKEQDEYNKKYQMALLQAQYGDYSGLKALGVDTSKMETAGGGGPRNPGNPPKPIDKDPAGGLDPAVVNDLKYQYGYELPPEIWNQYDAAALTEAGFRKKAAAPGHSGNTGGTAQKGKPGSAPSNRMDMMI